MTNQPLSRWTLLLLVTITALSCQNRTKEPWDFQKTVDIFTESALIEAQLANISKKAERDSLSVVYYQALFDHHHTDTAEFRQVYETLVQNPKKMEAVYAEVINQLSVMQSTQNE